MPRRLIDHFRYTWFTKSQAYISNDALQVQTLTGVTASVCIPLPTRVTTRVQSTPNIIGQQCWELLLPFARSLKRLVEPDGGYFLIGG